jgi:hypothetical protein
VPVTDEQRAMLQLLLEGGQGYDDIGSLLGIAPDEVRSRARVALTEIGGADPDLQVALSDYLLGQADPIGRADAVRHLQSDPDANALAQRLVQNLRLLAPKATLPEVPEPRRGGRRAAAPPPPPAIVPASSGTTASPAPGAPAKGPGVASRAAGFFSGLGSLTGKRRTQLIVGVATAVILVIVILVVATGGGGGGSGDCQPLNTTAAQQAGVPTTKLAAVGDLAHQDCPPAGQVTLVPVPPQQSQQSSRNKAAIAGFALQTNAAHLDPTSNGDEYVLWLYGSDQQARPIGQETVADSGDLNGAAPLATQELVYLQALQKIRLSRVTAAQKNQIQQALQAQQGSKKATGVIAFVGAPVLEGSGTDLLQQLQQQVQQAQSQAQSQGQAPTGTGASSGTKG